MKGSIVKFLVSASLAFAMLFPSHSTSSSSGYFIGYDFEQSSKIIAKDVYDLRIALKVPQVRNNSESTGTRKIERQTISGELHVLWKDDGTFSFETKGLYNSKFKVSGENVTYKGYAGSDIVYPRFNYIGSNLTGKFNTPCLTFSLVLEPSYAIEKVNEDNSFYLVLSGYGASFVKDGVRIAKRVSGNVAGSQGCGCMDYGHKSPTRDASVDGFSDRVSDVVSTHGTWSIRWKNRETR